jgi:hypothetical protein
MSILTAEEVAGAKQADCWNEQRIYIEKIEEALLDREGQISREDIAQVSGVLVNFISSDHARPIQRSLKIIGAITEIADSDAIASRLLTVVPQVFDCLRNSHQNVRDHSARTLSSLCAKSSWNPFFEQLGNPGRALTVEARLEVLQVIQTHQEQFTDDLEIASFRSRSRASMTRRLRSETDRRS